LVLADARREGRRTRENKMLLTIRAVAPEFDL
jgi:hypothetical protein